MRNLPSPSRRDSGFSLSIRMFRRLVKRQGEGKKAIGANAAVHPPFGGEPELWRGAKNEKYPQARMNSQGGISPNLNRESISKANSCLKSTPFDKICHSSISG